MGIWFSGCGHCQRAADLARRSPLCRERRRRCLFPRREQRLHPLDLSGRRRCPYRRRHRWCGRKSRDLRRFGWKSDAIDARQGKLLWKVRVDDHPDANIVGSPAAAGALVYFPVTAGKELESAIDAKVPCCTFRGSLVALRIDDGSQQWKSYTISEKARATGTTSARTPTWGPSGAGIWSVPTIDERRGVIYAATGVNYSNPPTSNSDAVVAFDLKTGHILWSQQMTRGDAFNFGCLIPSGVNCPHDHGPDHDIGAPPLLLNLRNGTS